MTVSSSRLSRRGAIAHTVAARCLCALLVSCVPLTAAEGATYCAYEVRVNEPSGKPFAGVPILLVHNGAQIAETRTDATGKARICDAPLDAVSIAVGFDICGSVVVRDLVPLWLRTRQVFVTYVRSTCGEFVSFPADCHLLVRVVDDKGRFLPGARLGPKTLEIGSGADVSDEFGRMFRYLKEHEKLDGVVTKEGYGSSPLSTKCSIGADTEMKVILRKQ